MKYTLSILTALLLMSFTPKEKNYRIIGQAKNAKEGEMVYLKVLDSNTHQFISLDSTPIHKEKFEFKGTAEKPLYSIIMLSEDNSDIIILEEGTISVDLNTDNLDSYRILGTKNNEDLNSFYSKVKKYQKEAKEYQEKNQDALTSAIKDNDTITLRRLSNEFKEYVENINNTITTQVNEFPKSLTSAIVIYQRLQNNNIDIQEATSFYNNLNEDVKVTNLGQAIKNILERQQAAKIEVGTKVPTITGPSINEKTLALQDNLGKVTILHFWAPWCHSCHETLPKVKELNKKYKNKGLKIFSVGLTEDITDWKNTIDKEHLSWLHILDIQDYARQFGVRSIPTVFVLDENGVVLDINHLEKNLDTLIEAQLSK